MGVSLHWINSQHTSDHGHSNSSLHVSWLFRGPGRSLCEEGPATPFLPLYFSLSWPGYSSLSYIGLQRMSQPLLLGGGAWGETFFGCFCNFAEPKPGTFCWEWEPKPQARTKACVACCAWGEGSGIQVRTRHLWTWVPDSAFSIAFLLDKGLKASSVFCLVYNTISVDHLRWTPSLTGQKANGP